MMTQPLPNYDQDGQTITLSFLDQKLQLTIITQEIIRVFEFRGDKSSSYAIEGEKQQPTDFTFNTVNNQYILKTAALTLKIDTAGHLDAYDAHDNPLVLDYRGDRHLLDKGIDKVHQKLVEAEGHNVTDATATSNTAYYEVVKTLNADEQFYGLGDKTGYLNKRGFEYDNWNTDNPEPHLENFTRLYKSIPILYGLNAGHPFGLFFDNPYRSHFDLGKEDPNYYFYSAVDGNLDYYIIGGHSLKQVVTNYTYLTGRVPLPQKWTLGYQQSRWGYSESEAEVQELADNFEKYDLPCDAIHFDVDYMEGYRVFTWDQAKYPSGPQNFVASLRKRGIKVVPIIDPGVKKDPATPYTMTASNITTSLKHLKATST